MTKQNAQKHWRDVVLGSSKSKSYPHAGCERKKQWATWTDVDRSDVTLLGPSSFRPGSFLRNTAAAYLKHPKPGQADDLMGPFAPQGRKRREAAIVRVSVKVMKGPIAKRRKRLTTPSCDWWPVLIAPGPIQRFSLGTIQALSATRWRELCQDTGMEM